MLPNHGHRRKTGYKDKCRILAYLRPPLRHVLIIGTGKDYQQRLQREFNGMLDLHFWDDPTGSRGLAQRAKSAERVFLCSDRARHSHQYALREGNVPFTLVGGGLSRLRTQLEDYALTTDE